MNAQDLRKLQTDELDARIRELRDELFHGIGLFTEPVRQLSIQAAPMTRPMCQLMEQNRIVTLCRPARRRARERITSGYLDSIVGRTVTGSVAAMPYRGSGTIDE